MDGCCFRFVIRKIFKHMSVVVRCMNLEPVIHCEVSEKEKNKCHILMPIYMESRKIVLMNLFAGQEYRHRCREWTVDTAEKGEGGTS
mgnify:CR=1 FL=1